MACGGIDRSNAADVIKETGVREIHFAADQDVDSAMTYRNGAVPMGTSNLSEYVRRETSEENVRDILQAINELHL